MNHRKVGSPKRTLGARRARPREEREHEQRGGGGGGGQAATVGGASGGSGVVILRHSTGLNIATVGLTKTTFQAGGGEEVTIITAGTGTIEFT